MIAGEWVQNEFDEIKTTLAAEKAITAPGWLIMFKVPQWRTRLLQGTLVQVFTQLSGISMAPSLSHPSRLIPYFSLLTNSSNRCDRLLPSPHVQRSRHNRRPRHPRRRNL